MDKFIRSVATSESVAIKGFMDRFGVDEATAEAMAEQVLSEELYTNGKYQVTKSKPHRTGVPGWPAMIHLSIIPLDGKPVHSWHDLQSIKNALVGPEFEAIEIYPAESRLVDMGHNYHLWVFSPEEFSVPIGWSKRMVKGE